MGSPVASSICFWKSYARFPRPLRTRWPTRPHHAQPSGCPQRHQRHPARRLGSRRGAGQRRPGGAGDRAFRSRTRLLRRLRPHRLRRASGHESWHSGDAVGSHAGLRLHEAQHRPVHEPLAVAASGGLQGSRLCDRRRKRHRALLRFARDRRNRQARLSARPRLGLPDHGDVGLSARPGTRQADAAHRRLD